MNILEELLKRNIITRNDSVSINEEVRKIIMNRGDANDIKQAAIRNGMTTMVQDALLKVSEGLTSIEEIIRVVHE